jgi:hypothetical protein
MAGLGIERSNGNHEMRVTGLKEGKSQVLAFGETPAFSKDSQWLARLIGIHEDQEAKLRKDKKPIRKKLTLLKLTTGATTTFDHIESFAFSKSGAYLAMRHYAPEKPGAPPPAENAPPPDPQGTVLTVRDLNQAANTTFGGVSAFAWGKRSSESRTQNQREHPRLNPLACRPVTRSACATLNVYAAF